MTENEAIELGKNLYENLTNNANNIIPTNLYIKFVERAYKALEELEQYKAIGTIEEFKTLKEKSVAKEMDRYYCPICRHYFEDGEAHNYCPECGQKLDWQ